MNRNVVGLLLLVVGINSSLSEATTEGERLFSLKIKPLLSQKCLVCHGGEGKKVKGGFDLSTRELLLKGGDEFSAAVVPGSSVKSFLMTAARWQDPDFEMPPKENDRLTAAQISDLVTWIDAGAPWPSEEEQDVIRQEERTRAQTEEGVIVQTSGGQSDDWTYRRYKVEDLWAFQPVVEPTVPDSESRNPIDAFVQTKLQSAGFEPTTQSDPLTLIRRAKYDLHGLPPMPSEIDSFKQAWAADPEKAWGDLIDRFLASKHYGERWGQHWLDVARYSDTAGFSNDYERSNAWRYRDYVIRSFNADKPYDQFVVEQLAGDELEPGNPEMLVATGFLRMGPWGTAMVKAPQSRQIYLDDVVNSVGQTFLSTTMRCLKCHDHKFDPIPTKDYYRMYATFAGTQMAERPASFFDEESTSEFHEGKDLVTQLLGFATDRKNGIVEKREKAARQWFEEHGLEYISHKERKGLKDEEKPPRHYGLDHTDEGRLKVREQDEWIWTRRLERYEPYAQSVYNGPDVKYANGRKMRMSSKNKAEWHPDSRIYNGGGLEAAGDKVGPGVLSVLGLAVPGREDNSDPYTIEEALENRRLSFAKWVASPKNPLTARSIVNRIWLHHFGEAIAGNPNNFGAKGGKPTHPKLLDWLANEFVTEGWTMKRLHRLIMMSETYRQSGSHAEMNRLKNLDPNNDLWAYYPPRRLSAEELRDGMLLVAGELNPTLGGLPIMPEINMEVALQPRMIQFSIAPAYLPSPTPDQRNRRSIYAYRVRGQADPFMELFNLPNSNDSCEARESASVTPQAFSMLNSAMMTDRSIAFALRVESEVDSLEAQVNRAINLALGRDATSAETDRLVAYVTEMRHYHSKHKPSGTHYPNRITRSLVEEFSGKPFEYEEILPVFEDYVSDKKPADVGAETRALADLCLLLFNSNEFVYVY